MLIQLMFSLVFAMVNLMLSVLAQSSRGGRRSGAPAAWIVLIVVGAVVLIALLRYAWWIFPLAVVGFVVWLLARNRAPKTPTTQDLMARLSQVPAMSGGQFEVFTADLIRALGYRSVVLGGSGDQGVDVIATATDGKIAIQCKNYRGEESLRAVATCSTL
jgi:HJR/Mrr/RecB family endonuclease